MPGPRCRSQQEPKRRAECDEARFDETAPYRREETVLFVDDEQPLRALGRDEIGLVIVDLTMPSKSGWEAFDEIRYIKPDVPVIVSSGYSIEGCAEAAMARGASAFLPKLYRAQQLLATMQEVLDREDMPQSQFPA